MIYLIDDKKTRQKDFGWSEERFAQYASSLAPLYNIDDVEKIGKNLYNKGNIILYHESFLDFTDDKDKAVEQRNKLHEKAKSDTGVVVAFFSGSQSARYLKGNIAHLPVAILYQNLEILIQQNNKGRGDLKYLLFGENPEIEEELNEKLTQANREIEESPVEISGKNLFIRPTSKFIQNAIKGATEGKIFNDVSDEKLSEKINEWLIETDYDNIFIPLCFGEILSDFNGLRLAAHIRCTPTSNQIKRIFIYSFVGIEYLYKNEYFNILKIKNVQLVDYSKKAFQEAANKDYTMLTGEELPKELSKLKLNPPKNYHDHHSITNEWAIHQWAKTIGCETTEELLKVFQNVESNLYFKYLRTVNPISDQDKFSPDKLKIKHKGEPRVLLIDDESEKGWYEIFAYLLGDLNGIYTDYLGDNFKNQSQEEIIDKSMQKITEDDIDVVILDFRLNPNDFIGSNPKYVSSILLLEKIKNFNPGIQVIIFSATNKVWNLQTLQDAGADGFIFKDVSENIHQNINILANKLTSSLHKAFTLKPIHKSFYNIKNNAINLSDTFKVNLANNLSVCFELLLKSFTQQKYLNYAYLQLYICIEDFLRQKQIFDYGDKCYVNQNIKVHEKISDNNWKSILKYHPPNNKESSYSYFFYEENEVEQLNITTDFKMSCVIVFLFNKSNSNHFYWPKIRDVRNKKAAHPEKKPVKWNEINEIISFMETTLNPSNFQEPSKKGLNDDIDPNSLKELQENFR